MQEILVDINGYNQFFQELDRLQELSRQNSALGSEVYQNAVGDGWHDNFAFEESMRESRVIAVKIDKMLQTQKFLKVVSTEQYYNDLINIGDILKLEIKYDFDDSEITIIRLTGKYLPDASADIQEISLNSPIGRAIYMKNIYDENIYYMVDNKKIKIKVIEKLESKN